VRLFPVLPALAALAALGLPATAQADVTTAVNGHTLTVTGSAGTDTITLRAAGGVITVNDVPTTCPRTAARSSSSTPGTATTASTPRRWASTTTTC